MLVKTLLKQCSTGFDLVIVADSVSGHTMEFDSLGHAVIDAGGNRVISWEVGISEDHEFVLFITI